MIYHEMAHYLFWTDAERKADAFSRQMVRGLRGSGRKARVRSPSGFASARRGAERVRRRRPHPPVGRRVRRRTGT